MCSRTVLHSLYASRYHFASQNPKKLFQNRADFHPRFTPHPAYPQTAGFLRERKKQAIDQPVKCLRTQMKIDETKWKNEEINRPGCIQ